MNPCLIESFLTSDPNLKQVVSRTFELGLRGKETYWNDGKLEWSAGLFHAMSFDDILPLAAPDSDAGFSRTSAIRCARAWSWACATPTNS